MYRGKEYEKIGDFVVRIQSQYPSAQVNDFQTVAQTTGPRWESSRVSNEAFAQSVITE